MSFKRIFKKMMASQHVFIGLAIALLVVFALVLSYVDHYFSKGTSARFAMYSSVFMLVVYGWMLPCISVKALKWEKELREESELQEFFRDVLE